MNIGKEYIKKILLCLCVLFFAVSSAEAVNNSLAGIDVKQNTKDAYSIILKLDGKTKINKITNANNRLTLMLNSTVPSDAIEIIYDNTSNINNVTVQKKNSDNTLVILEGKNISNANIFTQDISTGLINPINTETVFFGVNKDMLTFSIGAMFIWFLAIFGLKINRRKDKKMQINNKLKINQLRDAKYSRTTPSIAYTAENSFVSVPKDFVINKYMKNEKIKKAG